jgi:peptidoglycan/xylan/chitin deacetylase (PgdA/CDA1 family)
VLIATALLAGSSVAAALFGAAPLAVVVAAAALLALTAGTGAIVPSSGMFARPVLAVRTTRREIALTFDDGPDPKWTRAVLDLLEAHGHRGTFFVIGERAAQHAGLLAEMSRRGHEVANHTWTHSLSTVFMAPRRLARELERANDLIEQTTGTRPTWFRPPAGLLSPRIAPAVRLAGLRLVTWTASARDGVGFTTVRGALSRLDKFIVPGAIIVLHDAARDSDREPIACEVLRAVLHRMESAGLKSVRLSELCACRPVGSVEPHADSDHSRRDRAENNAQC